MSKKATFQHILIAFDGSTHSQKALDVAIGLTRALGFRLSLGSVEEHLPRFPADMGEVDEEKERQDEIFQKLQREAYEKVVLSGLDLHRNDILMGDAAKSIIEYAKSIKCDLIIIGHSGRSGAWGRFLDSTAEKVSRNAHCTVMIVR